MKIISWHPVLTDHMSYTLEALQRVSNAELVVNVSWDAHADREAQGWVKRHTLTAPIYKIPVKGWFAQVIKQLRNNRNAVHLFGSPFEQPRLTLILIAAVAMGLNVYLISEPYSPIAAGYQNDKLQIIGRIKSKLRPLIYRIYGGLLCRKLAGVFAISPLAVRQYRDIGIPSGKVFPFGYFVPRVESSKGAGISREPELRLIFIGTLIARKGLDILIEAVERLRSEGENISLDVYGPGNDKSFKFDQSIIRYCGSVPFGEAQNTIRSYDLLVLPSRYDGWGVVVNEALLAGVPVICSDQVGASAVVRRWNCGRVFESENVEDLYKNLMQLIKSSENLLQIREAAPKAGMALLPEVAGAYMHDAIRGNSVGKTLSIPSCPWYES